MSFCCRFWSRDNDGRQSKRFICLFLSGLRRLQVLRDRLTGWLQRRLCFGKESADITGYWSKSRHHRGVDRLRHSEAAAARHIRRLLWREPMLRLQRWPRKTFARRRQRQGSIAASPGQLIGRRTTRAALPSRCDARRLESVRDFLVREEPMPSRRLRSARTGGTIAATAQSVVSTHTGLY